MSYDDDLAAIHHAGFGGFSRDAAPDLIRRVRRAGFRGGRVVDLGSGDGSLVDAFARAGYDAAGVEQSPAFVRLAKRDYPDRDFVRASLYDFDLPQKCVAITAIGEVFSYRTDDDARVDLRPIFRRVSRALQRGGLFIFDLLITGEPPMDYRTWVAGDDWAVLIDATERKRSVVREITTFRRTSATYRRRSERHVVDVHDPERVVSLLAAAHFSVERLLAYGKARLPFRRMAFAARRL